MHRDFKVDNLFMHDDTVIIADLGFAKAGREMTGTQCGTPMYMAPEIFAGKKYTNLADLWSVGVSFYELLFGKYPFNGMSQGELIGDIHKRQGSNLVIDRSINNISKECEDLLKSILTEDPDQRLSWKKFFDHPVFNKNQDNHNPMTSVIQNPNKMKVTQMWNQAKTDHQDTNDMGTLMPAHNMNNQADLNNVADDGMATGTEMKRYEDRNQQAATWSSNSHRYEHECNKIKFIIDAAQKLREFTMRIQ